MTPFVAISWNSGCSEASGTVNRLRTILAGFSGKWHILHDEPGALIAIPADGRFLTKHLDGHPVFIIGDLFGYNNDEPKGLLSADRSFENFCKHLTESCWGAYCAISVRGAGYCSVYRDLVGMQDAISWYRSGLRLIASDSLPWLSVLPPAGLDIDWLRLAGLLHDSSTVYETPPLTGVETVPPGSGAVGELVGIEGDVVSGVLNPDIAGVGAPA